MFWFFDHKACGILAPWPGIEPALPALEGEVLTTGPPGKYQELILEHIFCVGEYLGFWRYNDEQK